MRRSAAACLTAGHHPEPGPPAVTPSAPAYCCPLHPSTASAPLHCLCPQIRTIRRKMVEIMTREATSCDLKELVREGGGLAQGLMLMQQQLPPAVCAATAGSSCSNSWGLVQQQPPPECAAAGVCSAAGHGCRQPLPRCVAHSRLRSDLACRCPPLAHQQPLTPPLMPLLTPSLPACSPQVGKFIPEAIGKEIEKACQGIYPLQVRGQPVSCLCRATAALLVLCSSSAAAAADPATSSAAAAVHALPQAVQVASTTPLKNLTAHPFLPLPAPTPQNTFVRKVKLLRAPKFDINKLMEVREGRGDACWVCWYCRRSTATPLCAASVQAGGGDHGKQLAEAGHTPPLLLPCCRSANPTAATAHALRRCTATTPPRPPPPPPPRARSWSGPRRRLWAWRPRRPPPELELQPPVGWDGGAAWGAALSP